MSDGSHVVSDPVCIDAPGPSAAEADTLSAEAGTSDRDVAGRFALEIGRVLVVAVSAAAIVAYVVIALRRVGHPFDLEWIEDTAVIQVHRILHGQSLYVAPSVRFVPDGYPPLYFYLSAPLAWVLGVSYLPLRLVSFASSLATMAIIYRLVKRETAQRVAAIGAVGIFAASFGASGWWFDLARVDSLFIALCVGAVYMARWSTTPRAAGSAGAVMALSFLTKQTALAVALAVITWYLSSRQRRNLAIAFGATFFGIVALTTVAIGIASHGWYVFYVFEVLPHQQIVRSAWLDFWRIDVVAQLWPTLALAALVTLTWWYVHRRARRDPVHGDGKAGTPGAPSIAGFYVAVSIGMLAGAWASRIHSGGFDNVLIPVFAAVAIVAGLGAGRLGERFIRDRLRRWAAPATFAAQLAIVGQIGLLALSHPYGGRIPTPTDTAEGKAFVGFLRSVPGFVYVPSHPYYTLLAGKTPFAHQGAVSDIVRSAGETEAIRDVQTSVHKAVEDGQFSVVVTDSAFDDIALPPDFYSYYRPCPTYLFESVPLRVFSPVTDLYVRPHQMFVRRGNGVCPPVPDFARIARG